MDISLTFENLPQAVSALGDKIEKLQEIIIDQGSGQAGDDDKILNTSEAAKLLGYKIQTVYVKVSHNQIPYMKIGNNLRFSRNELIEFMRSNRRPTNAELEEEIALEQVGE